MVMRDKITGVPLEPDDVESPFDEDDEDEDDKDEDFF